MGRISQQSGSTTEYFLGDALGSVRQLTSQSGGVTYAKSYDPYGVVTQSSGEGQSAYGYTGEQQSNDMVYLRARYYNPADGRFQSRDTFAGSYNSPQSLNRWNYTQSNPINYTDPSGNYCIAGIDVDFLGGDKCTYDDQVQAEEAWDYLAGYWRTPNAALGFAYEFLDAFIASRVIVSPETALMAWSLILKMNPTLNDTAQAIAFTASLCGNNSLTFALNVLKNGIQGDYYFNMGRAMGRVSTLILAGAALGKAVGGTVISVAAAVPTGGFSLTEFAIDIPLAIASVSVIANVAIKEANDHLMAKALTGEIGGGGDPTTNYGTNAGSGATVENARRLRGNMENAGMYGEGQAHHIVPSTHWYAKEAREMLWKKFHIDINDATNGVYLPPSIHNGLANNHRYMDAVLDELSGASSSQAADILQSIGERLLNGTFPR